LLLGSDLREAGSKINRSGIQVAIAPVLVAEIAAPEAIA